MNDSNKFKYPSTYHFPWSNAATSDDKIFTNLDIQKKFYSMEDVFASIKMDGENTTIGKTFSGDGYSHARSLDSKDHWSRHHIKQLSSELQKDIEPGWRICGENLMAVHSIKYDNLESFFYVFSVWDENNIRLSLDEMIEYCDFLGLTMAPILKRGPFRGFYFGDNLGLDLTKDEGYVISNSNRFHYNQLQNNVAKFVRKDHVQTEDKHWFHKAPERNELKNKGVNL